jgi:signal transduction histidine kinase/CBS domain-containing protein
MSTRLLPIDAFPPAVDPVPLKLDTSVDLLTAISLMHHSFPVAAAGRYVLVMSGDVFQGIFTERDVVRLIAEGRDLATTNLGQAIGSPATADGLLLAEQQVLPERGIASRRRIEASLQETTDRYNSIMSALDVGIIFQGADGRVLTCNASAARIMGLSMEELLERSSYDGLWQIIHEDGSPFSVNQQPSMKSFQTGLSYREVVMGLVHVDQSALTDKSIHADPEVTWISVNSRPLWRDGDPTPYAVVASFTDITEKKQLEQQFLRVQRLECLGTLSSGIAHDMNNIFTPILAATQLLPLTITNLNARSRRLIEMLEESAHRGTHLVQQILTFARGSNGQREYIEVLPVLEEVVSVAQQTFPGSIEIITDFPNEPLAMILADATQLHQVLMNLVVNARDAMPKGGELHFRAANIELDAQTVRNHLGARVGAYVAITVGDTGVGIEHDSLDKIFDPFFTTKGLDQGTGLGLSTVLTIVKGHGGFLIVDSQIGQGTEFQVCLPCGD